MGNNKDEIMCKLDMEKTYDYVSWDFVDYMLGRLGFGRKWRHWIQACITSTILAIMINFGPSSFFKAS